MVRRKPPDKQGGASAVPPFRQTAKPAYRSIKIPLKAVLRNRQTVQPAITNLVFMLNDLVIHTYQFIRLFILYRVTARKQECPTVDETFVLYCIKTLGSRDARGRSAQNVTLRDELQTFYDTEYQPLVEHVKPDLRRTTHILPYIATQIHTALSVNIQEHFVQHLLRFINRTTQPIEKGEDRAPLFRFKKRILEGGSVDVENEETEALVAWRAKHLPSILPARRPILKSSVHYDVKVHPFDYLPGMLYMNSVLETMLPPPQSDVQEDAAGKEDIRTTLSADRKQKRHPDDDGPPSSFQPSVRLFQPLPLRTNIIPKHIILDTASIIDFFCPDVRREGGRPVKKAELMAHIEDSKAEVWGEMLNLRHKVFRNPHYTFHHQIQTDGVSVSLLFIRKDIVAAGPKKRGDKIPVVAEQTFCTVETVPDTVLDSWKGRTIIGCDPGKRSLVYMASADEGCRATLQYTSPQRRRESTTKRNSQILRVEKRRSGVQAMEAALAKHNAKTVDYETFKAYLVAKTRLNADAATFYQREVWRSMKFRQHAYGQKGIDRFLDRIRETFGENLLIGYGNWSQGATQMRNNAPSLGKGLRKLIHRRYDTVTIDECNTSRKCAACNNNLTNYNRGCSSQRQQSAADTDSPSKKVFRLLTCTECVSPEGKRTAFWTRDVNSAVNIARLTRRWIVHRERPACFQRISSFTTSLPSPTGVTPPPP